VSLLEEPDLTLNLSPVRRRYLKYHRTPPPRGPTLPAASKDRPPCSCAARGFGGRACAIPASSAYLTASEIFPLETRALAIACFYALGTAIGGSTSPLLSGWLIESGSAWRVSLGYATAALLLLLAAVTELKYGVDAEGKSLESIAEPLSD
jgi:MFS family permease